MDQAFTEAVATARGILKNIIAHTKANEAARAYAAACYEAATDKRVVICDQQISKGYFVEYPETQFLITPNEVDGVVNWRATAIPVDYHTFEVRTAFPEAWAGLRDQELAKVSGIGDALFVHKARFLFVAKSKEGAEAAVNSALQS